MPDSNPLFASKRLDSPLFAIRPSELTDPRRYGNPLFHGEITARHPTLKERLGDDVYDIAQALGLRSQANRMRHEAMASTDFIPLVSEAVGAQGTVQDFTAGDYLKAAIGAVGVVPAVGGLAAKVAKTANGIRRGQRLARPDVSEWLWDKAVEPTPLQLRRLPDGTITLDPDMMKLASMESDASADE